MFTWRTELYSHVDEMTIRLIVDSAKVRASLYTDQYGCECSRVTHAEYEFPSFEEAVEMLEKIIEHHQHTRLWIDQEDLHLL
jgi:hypothetical protein